MPGHDLGFLIPGGYSGDGLVGEQALLLLIIIIIISSSSSSSFISIICITFSVCMYYIFTYVVCNIYCMYLSVLFVYI